MTINAIQTDNLTKNFGDLVAVDHVSFSVKKGEIFGFLGPNGAGKSTTIRMLCTLTRPTSGTAIVAGYDVKTETSEVRKHIGLVSEKLIMYDRLTARENLRLFGKLYNIPQDALEKRIDELLHFVRMKEWGDKTIGTFSTGMKQRINVIRAMLNTPEILFLDEPTLGLDPQSTSDIRDIIRRINKENNATIILTTHMMVEADVLCDRIGIIDHGKIAALDTSKNLKRMVSNTDAQTIEFELMNPHADIIAGIKSLPDVTSVIEETEALIKVRTKGDNAFDAVVDAIRAKNGKIRSAKTLEPSLEDVFLHLTGHEVRDEKTRTNNNHVGRHGRRRGPPSRGRE